MKNHLFLFTIGSVQSYISQARKAQDLFAGSIILAELLKMGMEYAINNLEAEMIFPDPDSKNIPNRFIAKIKAEPDTLIQKGKDLERYVKERYLVLANETFQQNREKATNPPKGFDEQIEKQLDIFWIFEEIVNDNYGDAFQIIQSKLDALKNTRLFDQMEEIGRKCSVDGERNALFFGREQPYLAIMEQRENVLTKQTFWMDQKEGLSAISFAKRFYKKTSFPSTAEVALYFDEIKTTQDIKDCLLEYKKIFEQNTFISKCLKENESIIIEGDNINDYFDYQMLFDENITSKNFPDATQLAFAQKYVAKLNSYFNTRYYVLVCFDGDDMGKWLSGKYIDSTDIESFHKSFSKTLSGFAAESKNTVDTLHSKNCVVYTGGDDFLGLMNINCLFEAYYTLQKKFKEMGDDVGLTKFRLQKPITFSSGIVIAHYKTPLNEVLAKARQLQKEAKQKYSDHGKDAVGIAYMTRASVLGETYFQNRNMEILQELILKFKEEEISPTFLYKYASSMMSLNGKQADLDSFYTQVQVRKTELKRLMKRACKDGKWKDIEKQLFEPLFDHILLPELDRDQVTVSIENFISFVKIADRMANIMKKWK